MTYARAVDSIIAHQLKRFFVLVFYIYTEQRKQTKVYIKEGDEVVFYYIMCRAVSTAAVAAVVALMLAVAPGVLHRCFHSIATAAIQYYP